MTRKNVRHPLAVEAAHQKAAAEALTRETPQKGWSWSFGWIVILADDVGAKRYRHCETYREAVIERDAELSQGRTRYAWILAKSFGEVAYDRVLETLDDDDALAEDCAA